MTCDEMIDLLSASLDGPLTPSEQAAMDAHLASCPRCSALFADLTALRDASGDLEELTAPEGFTEKAMAAIRAEESKVVPFPAKRRQPWVKWAACVAAVVVIVTGAVALPSAMNGSFDMAPESAMKEAPNAADGVLADFPAYSDDEYVLDSESSDEESKSCDEESYFVNYPVDPDLTYYAVMSIRCEGTPDAFLNEVLESPVTNADGSITYVVSAYVVADLMEEYEPTALIYGPPDAPTAQITVYPAE